MIKNIGAWFKALMVGGVLAAGLFVVSGHTAQAAAGINKTINFQGKVTNPNGTNVTNGTYTFVFKFYTVSSGGVAVWTETDSLVVTSGVFQVNLGLNTSLPGSVDFNTDNIFLGITFNSDPAGEMSPRIQLTASPYSFNSDMLDGLDSTAFVKLAQGVQTDSSTTNPSIFINKTNASGTPNILELQKSGADVFAIGNTGGVTMSPSGSSDVIFNQAAGSNLQITATAASTVDMVAITNSGQVSATTGADGISLAFGSSNASGDALHITPSYAGGATDGLTYNVIESDAFSPTNASGADAVNGFKIGNMTDPGITINSSAINIGTGWDYGLVLNDTTPSFKLAATDDTADFNIFDNCSSGCANAGTVPNSLFELKDLSTNFGGLAISGAFMSNNTYFGEEFTNPRTAASCAADTAQARGAGSTAGCTANTGVMSVGTAAGGTAACTISTPADTSGGFERITANDGNNTASCEENIGSSTANDAQLMFNSNNLPVVQMKVRPSATDATNGRVRYFTGIGNLGTAGTGANTDGQANMDATNDSGIYFSNCSAPTTPTCTATTWQVSIENAALAGTKISTANCGVTISTGAFAYMRIELVTSGATPTVRAYVDGDVSDGINPTLCPAFATSIDISNLAWGWFAGAVSVDPSNTILNFDIDYVRIWQDDPAGSPAQEEPAANSPAADGATLETGAPLVPSSPLANTDIQLDNLADASAASALDLSVPGLLTAQGGLVVGGPAEFHDTSVFFKLASFVEKTVFHNDITIEGRATFNNDTGGFAVIKKGQQEVKVLFKKPYDSQPIVTVSIKNGQFALYSYKDLSPAGFTIMLPGAATGDTEFAWTALNINNPNTSAGTP